jgi:hypothetical protein
MAAMMMRAGGAIHVAGARYGGCLKPTSDSMAVPGSLPGGPAFETEENMARVVAFLSAALAPFGKAALDKAS